MMNRTVVAATAAILFAVIPAGSALAQGYERTYREPIEQYVPVSPYDNLTTGSVGSADGPLFDRCPEDSAAEGNANQQNRLVKQYGQTSGGPRC